MLMSDAEITLVFLSVALLTVIAVMLSIAPPVELMAIGIPVVVLVPVLHALGPAIIAMAVVMLHGDALSVPPGSIKP